MLHTEQTEQKQSEKSHGDVENTQNNKNYYRKKIENTPLTVEHDPEKGYRIGIGNEAVTDWLNAWEYDYKIGEIEKQDWTMLLTAIAIIADKVIERKTLEMYEFLKENKSTDK